MTDRHYCSDLSLAAGEPLLGTADRVDVWLLLEYKPVWRSKAVEDNDLSSTARAWLQRQIDSLADKGLKARPQFVRQPELELQETALFVGTTAGLFRFRSVGYQAITQLDVANDEVIVARGASTAFTRVDECHYFVCTNGQRDLCCARYGLPTYTRLRELVGDRVWQTTHLGGHRFAPNVLALPQGVLYGRVKTDAVSDFVMDVEAGRLSKAHARGRSVFPPEAQAAEVLLGETVLELVDCADGRVVVRTETGERAVAVELGQALDIVASCRDEMTKPIQPFNGKLTPL